MTALQLYDACLVELNKVDAPNILLEDFNYLANKAINNYINKRYNIYDVNQQTTDDLRVLKASAILKAKKCTNYTQYIGVEDSSDDEDFLSLADAFGFMGATYEVELPNDYLHILNCECVYKVNSTLKCYNKGYPVRFQATRLTADLYSQVLDNYWNRPSYKKPYYYIHNVNISNDNPTNPYSDDYVGGTDVSKFDDSYDESDDRGGKIVKVTEGVPTTISLKDLYEASNIQREAQVRYGNVSDVRMEIRYGSDDSDFKLKYVLIDYIKTPQHIRLTQDQLDKTTDTSQMLEFPDYVCQEIVNELVHIIMELISDPRLQTHPVVSQSIANPVQQQAAQPAASAAQ